MHYKDTVKVALQKPTLLEALSYVCDVDCDRAVKQALKNTENNHRELDGKLYDTCFTFLLKEVLDSYGKVKSEDCYIISYAFREGYTKFFQLPYAWVEDKNSASKMERSLAEDVLAELLKKKDVRPGACSIVRQYNLAGLNSNVRFGDPGVGIKLRADQ